MIDTHTHLGGFPSVDAIKDDLGTRTGVAGWRSKHPDVYAAVASEKPVDNSADLLAAMDRNGVEVSIVQPTVGVPNEDVAAWAAPHDRLVPLAWVAQMSWDGRYNEDPSDEVARQISENAALVAQRAITEQGFAGIGETCARDLTRHVDPVKIAKDFAPLLDVLEEKGRMIQFPTGWTQFPGNQYYLDPLWVDEIAGRHPGATIILTKMGRGIQRFFDSALTVALRNRNVCFDMLATTPEHLRVALDVIGPDRIMFATDWSYTWRYLSSPHDVYSSSMAILDAATNDPGVKRAVLETTAQRVFAHGLS